MPKKGERTPLLDRFWAKVDKSAATGCWLWIGAKDGPGYGIIGAGGRHGKLLKAHRLSWELHNGSINNGLWVLHKCDTPTCVNPEHLYLGDVFDNNRDRVLRGRSAPTDGENHPRTKLTNAAALEIYKRANSGDSIGTLATEYNVERSVIKGIKIGQSWSSVTKAIRP